MGRLFGLLMCLLPGLALGCGAIAQGPAPFARVLRAGTAAEGVEISFLGHASFLIRSPGGVTAATEYNGTNIPAFPPDIATMSIDHFNHYTPNPDPRIAHVLHGWREDGRPAEYDLTVGDMRVRNLATNTRAWGNEAATRMYGNSVFIFETGGLCIAHLGHLHHLLDDDDLANLGPIDVLMVPMDGAWTMNHADMAAVVLRVHPRVVLAMHYFSDAMLQRFARLVAEAYPLRVADTATVVLTRESLPTHGEILVLPGSYY